MIPPRVNSTIYTPLSSKNLILISFSGVVISICILIIFIIIYRKLKSNKDFDICCLEFIKQFSMSPSSDERKSKVTVNNKINKSFSMRSFKSTDCLDSEEDEMMRKSYLSLVRQQRKTAGFLSVPEKPVKETGPRRASVQNFRYLKLVNNKEDPFSQGKDYKLGSLHFIIEFSKQKNTIHVSMLEVKDISITYIRGGCKFHICINLTPGSHKTLSTKTICHTINPRFQEEKTFSNISESKLEYLTLNLKLCDWKDSEGEYGVGEINLSLQFLLEASDVDDKRIFYIEKFLSPVKKSDKSLGSIFVSLSVNMKKEKLLVSVLKGKGLKALELNNSSNPYCLIKLVSSNTKLGTRRTSVKYKTTDPVWNEPIIFNITQKHFLENICLKIKVFSKGRLTKNEIGEIEFPSKSGTVNFDHWYMMVNNEGETISEWHSLQSS